MYEEDIKQLVSRFLALIGEDPQREGLLRTPERVANAWQFLTKGYRDRLEDVINGAIFEETTGDVVVVKDVDFYSMCEHHLLPFFGKAHVAYVPDGRIIGISKIPRIIEMYARRLQVQERLTEQIAQTLCDVLKPKGVAVVLQAQHLCMIMRGVEKKDSLITTRAFHGCFRDDANLRREFLDLLRLEVPR
ncbi:MAG: GTP cyclohydrolase I FolE [candidate division KSB1 bacterium]|nr:GTP cyclohydrolase I FolE [candidate division KSB1 bacterium]